MDEEDEERGGESEEQLAAIGSLKSALVSRELDALAHAIDQVIELEPIPWALPHLCEALTVSDAGIRGMAAHALGGLGEKAAVGPLVACLLDPSTNEEMEEVIGALACPGLEDRASVEALIPLLTHPDESTRASAASALGYIAYHLGDAHVSAHLVETLSRALEDPSRYVHEEAIAALGRMRHADAVDHLLRELRSGDLLFRRCAAQALARVATPAALDALRTLVSDADDVLRSYGENPVRSIW